jgi:23S rRNA (guanosine2251-2'-O)-methyltransferase
MSRNRRINPRSRGKPGKGAKPGESELIYGFHAVRAALANPARRKHRLMLTEEARAGLGAQGLTAGDFGGVEALDATRRDIDALLPPGAVHQGICLDCSPLPAADLAQACTPDSGRSPVIVLDQVSDPHNVGAILRSAAAFGARAVILQERHSPTATGALAKAASGALETVPLVRVTNLVRAMERLKEMGYWLTGLDAAAETRLGAGAWRHPVALVLGAEGSGLRRLTRDNCDSLASIKLADAMHSLNVSNAAAVALYQITVEI